MEPLNVLRSGVTLVSFVVFVIIVVRAWSSRNRQQFEEAEQLPFEQD
jgi:cytochrome c oxidase cbb3-type subunit 4